MKYSEIRPDMELPYWTVLLYQYPRQIQHWVLIKVDDKKREIYFMDPYGKPPDTQWPYLENPEGLPEPKHVLSEIIQRYVLKGYKYDWNTYNIQGTIRNGEIRDSECGEIVILRIVYHDLSDKDFYELCLRLGGYKIFDLVKKIEES
jgi:hypothetical protein